MHITVIYRRYGMVKPVSPRPADPAIRATLIETAARILATDGPHALSTRRLAAEAGTSTMAVYTHFGSMDQLRRAIRAEGFARLAGQLDALPHTEDAVADLAAGGLTYLASGLASPELYRAMFTDRPPEGDGDAGAGIFQRLAGDVTRCITAGRFCPADPALATAWAGEVWTMRHGVVTLALTGLLPLQQVRFLLIDMTYRLAIGYGDDPSAARRSVDEGRCDQAAQ
jgi:AcrR family transcriptional regulator